MLIFKNVLSVGVFELCGKTVHREGPCFLADSQSRFQWPSCVSQWHGAAMRHAWEGASSSLTSYSRFLIFSGLYELRRCRQMQCWYYWTRVNQGCTHAHSHTHSHTRTQWQSCASFSFNHARGSSQTFILTVLTRPHKHVLMQHLWHLPTSTEFLFLYVARCSSQTKMSQCRY